MLIITNFQRTLNIKYRLRAKALIGKVGQQIADALMPEKAENWQTITIQEAIKKHNGVDNFFQTTDKYYKLPIMVVMGTTRKRLFK